MIPTLFEKDYLKEIFQSPILRRFPSLQFDDVFSTQKGLTISEGEKDISIAVDMPGLDTSDIDVKLANGLLIISGEKKQEVEDEERRFYSVSSRNYKYTIDLPVTVDETKVDAYYAKGVMHVTIPKTQPAQSKKITVRNIESTTTTTPAIESTTSAKASTAVSSAASSGVTTPSSSEVTSASTGAGKK